jgi:hypothetical protein
VFVETDTHLDEQTSKTASGLATCGEKGEGDRAGSNRRADEKNGSVGVGSIDGQPQLL